MRRCLFGVQKIFLMTMLAVSLAALASADEPLTSWGTDPSHNHVKEASNLPVEFTSATQIWEVATGAKHQFPMPAIVGDKCLVGSDGGGNPDPLYSRGGALTCRSLKDGSMLWRLVVQPPKGASRNAYGMCGVPVVEGNRVYAMVDFDLFCIDLNGMADGNHGYQNELEFLRDGQASKWKGEPLPADYELPEWAADIIWHFSLVPFKVRVQDSTSCSPVLVGDQLWFSTAEEYGSEARDYNPNQDPPHMVVIDKNTGKLIARDQMDVPIVFHGEWSSPSLIEANGEQAVIFPDGYGVLHAFKIPEPSADGQPVTLEEYWTFDMNPPEFRTMPDGREIVYTLDRRLEYKYPKDYYTNPEKYYMYGADPVNPEDKDFKRVGFSNKNDADGRHETVVGPCEIISMPAVVGNRIYLGIGRDRAYGLGHGKGRFMCLEVNDVKEPPEILWEDREVGRTQCTASIADGLCYVADGFGKLNCWDAETGEVIYRYEIDRQGIRERSQMVTDGKIYICDERKQMKVIKAGREPVLLGESRLKSDAATIDAADGLVLVVTHRNVGLYGDKAAIEKMK